MSGLTMVGQLPGHSAAADLSAKQYYLVKISAADKVNLCGAGEVAAGVLINKPASGIGADVFRFGPGEVLCDGNAAAIAAGDPLKSDANGKAVKAATNHDHIIGWADEASTVADQVIKALLCPGSLSHA